MKRGRVTDDSPGRRVTVQTSSPRSSVLSGAGVVSRGLTLMSPSVETRRWLHLDVEQGQVVPRAGDPDGRRVGTAREPGGHRAPHARLDVGAADAGDPRAVGEDRDTSDRRVYAWLLIGVRHAQQPTQIPRPLDDVNHHR